MPAAKVSRRAAGEGLGHTARMYVSEESHSGIVPLNHSNKDGTSLAESEEGRLPIKENTFPSRTYPTQKSGAFGLRFL
jgi:RNA-directed DNA polymerase